MEVAAKSQRTTKSEKAKPGHRAAGAELNVSMEQLLFVNAYNCCLVIKSCPVLL